MIIPSEEEIILINKKIGHNVTNFGNVSFLISKLKSMRLVEDEKKNIAKAAANIWYDIISLHPFSDGNKRTAAETMKYFLELNKYIINLPPNGIIYISLRIANNDISLNELLELIYQKIEVR